MAGTLVRRLQCWLCSTSVQKRYHDIADFFFLVPVRVAQEQALHSLQASASRGNRTAGMMVYVDSCRVTAFPGACSRLRTCLAVMVRKMGLQKITRCWGTLKKAGSFRDFQSVLVG